MRSWRALLALWGAYLLIGGGVRLGVATFSAAEMPAVLAFIGNFWLDYAVWALPVPIVARAVVRLAKSLGLGGKRLMALNVIGILALPRAWQGLAAYERWERRPAPAECTAKPILLTLADMDEAVPRSNAVRLYLGPDIRADGRYLFLPAHRRSICRDTSNGAERLATSALSIELWSPPLARCGSVESYRWERLLCARRDDDSLRTLPHDIVFFDPDGIRLGDSGISTAATDECYPLTEAERLVVAKSVDVGPVKAVCRTEPFPDGSTLCRMRRDVGAGVSMYWDLYSPTNAIDDHLLQAKMSPAVSAQAFSTFRAALRQRQRPRSGSSRRLSPDT